MQLCLVISGKQKTEGKLEPFLNGYFLPLIKTMCTIEICTFKIYQTYNYGQPEFIGKCPQFCEINQNQISQNNFHMKIKPVKCHPISYWARKLKHVGTMSFSFQGPNVFEILDPKHIWDTTIISQKFHDPKTFKTQCSPLPSSRVTMCPHVNLDSFTKVKAKCSSQILSKIHIN